MSSLVVHFEIHASEPQQLMDFYADVLGWRFTQFGEMPYWSIDTGEGAVDNVGGNPGHGINGGLTPREGPRPEVGAPVNGTNLVIAVDDIDATYARAVELGAVEVLPLTDMEGVGRVANLLDPDHNLFGLISATMSDGSTPMSPDAG